jgi:hypothetical protein
MLYNIVLYHPDLLSFLLSKTITHIVKKALVFIYCKGNNYNKNFYYTCPAARFMSPPPLLYRYRHGVKKSVPPLSF